MGGHKNLSRLGGRQKEKPEEGLCKSFKAYEIESMALSFPDKVEHEKTRGQQIKSIMDTRIGVKGRGPARDSACPAPGSRQGERLLQQPARASHRGFFAKRSDY